MGFGMHFVQLSFIFLIQTFSIVYGFYQPCKFLSVKAAQSGSRNKCSLMRSLKMSGTSPSVAVLDAKHADSTSPFACPQCGSPAELKDNACSNCGAPFVVRDGFVDLTPESTKVISNNPVKSEPSQFAELVSNLKKNPFVTSLLASSGLQFAGAPIRQELFRTPLVSYLYERGWRQGFDSAGFPGIDKEYELAMEFFQGANPARPSDLAANLP